MAIIGVAIIGDFPMDWAAIAWFGGGILAGGLLERLRARPIVQDDTEPSTAAQVPPQPTSTQSPAPVSDEQWQLAYHLAAEMAQLKAGFLARTSHELRSPLNSVIGLHQLILTDLCDDPEEEREFVGQAHEAALRLLKLLDQVTDLSKLEHGRATLEITKTDLNELLLEAEQVVQIQAQNRNLRLTIEHPEAPIRVYGDRQRLLQVLIHLLSAPISLMDSGHVGLKVLLEGGQARIQVADQRPANTWAEPKNLLQPQAQPLSKLETISEAQANLTNAAPGLTIMLCQQLLARMGGDLMLVEVAAEAGEGEAWTRLECRLPVVA
ncbi:MAG: sensor histidine kinase [Elainellaceae cyanobacterium]